MNRKRTDEASAIDFLAVTENIEQQIEQLIIDEEGKFLLHGSAPSDHNSFKLIMSIESIEKGASKKVVKWRLNAPAEKWRNFEERLKVSSSTCTNIMNKTSNMNMAYQQWKK